MKPTVSPRFARSAVALCLASAVASGCHHTPSDLRVWTPADHDAEAAIPPTPDNDDPLAAGRALYAAQCASCHGPGGHGDGPMGVMFRPADLTSASFQSSHSDADLAHSITEGKGRMPAFGATLRPEAVQALVRLIRAWRQ